MGTNLKWFPVLFIGWFGPRGIASVLYLLVIVNELGVEGHERILSIIILTIMLSIFLHGLTAAPMARLYGRLVGEQAGEPPR